VLCALIAPCARAEDMMGADLTAPSPTGEAPPVLLSGTLKKVRDSGTLTIGYRESSFPFSFIQPGASQPLGYSIAICLGVVEEIARELNGAPIRVAYVPVTSDSRIEAVTSGAVDLECGSTTSNSERQKSVAFSPIIYIAGTKLLVKRGSAIGSFRDLSGKRLVVTSGTTNAVAMKELNDKLRLNITIVAARDHGESYLMLEQGRVDAFATDDVLLTGFVAAHKAEASLTVVGDFITYEPYGLMFRRDDPLMSEAVMQAFSVMAKSHRLADIYRTWFLQPTPTGELLNLPMNVQLTEVFHGMGAED